MLKTTRQPSITVIIPAYNSEKYIKECLDSVYSQTVPVKQVIVIDDGSTDSTRQIVTAYQAERTNLQIIAQVNCGQGIARNTALNHANGEHVLFLDSDDTIEPTLLEEFSGVMLYDPDIFHFNWRRFDNAPSSERVYTIIDNDPVVNQYILRGSDCDQMLTITNYFSANNIFKKQFLDKYTIRYGAGTVYEDNVFMVQAITNARTIAMTRQALYNYRFHSRQSTRQDNTGPLHFKQFCSALVAMRQANRARTKYSNYYLHKYMLSKLLVYVERRIPRRYHHEMVRAYVKTTCSMKIQVDPRYPSRFLQLCLQLGVFEKKRYKVLLQLVRLKIAYAHMRALMSR